MADIVQLVDQVINLTSHQREQLAFFLIGAISDLSRVEDGINYVIEYFPEENPND